MLPVDLYSKKTWWKISLLILALLIAVSSLLYTRKLVKKLEVEERKKVELWAEGIRQLASSDNLNQDISFIFTVIRNNETVPVIVVDQNENIITFRNLDTLRTKDSLYLKEQLYLMKKAYPPIEIRLNDTTNQYVYYKDSYLLEQLIIYPYVQLVVFFIFILVAYLAFSSLRRAEQNQVWMGMAKETAHQLGTPISSLMAWIELIKLNNNVDNNSLSEIEQDVARLKLIADRFSKIGSIPKTENLDILSVIVNVTNYMKRRSSSDIVFNLHFDKHQSINVPIIEPLFEWVLENLYKNAIDAMNGKGSIDIYVSDHIQYVYIDIKDSGKGIPKSKYKTVFKPGYTTKERGWGLGLSLVKRIIEEYHRGKIFIKQSELNKGTTFRIVLFRY